jgi:hypothetical protein
LDEIEKRETEALMKLQSQGKALDDEVSARFKQMGALLQKLQEDVLPRKIE